LARAWDIAALSDTTPAFSSFTYDSVSPTIPMLLAPRDGITVTGAPTGFFWLGPLVDTGSALAYNLHIDDKILTQPVTHYVPSGRYAPGVHTWGVRAFDAAGNHSPWTQPWSFFVDDSLIHLPLMLKNYRASEVPACVDAIVNGGFELDEGWIINSTPVPAAYTSDQAYSGARSMRLGIVPTDGGTGFVSYSSVDQTVPLPDGTNATLSFWVYPFNENGDVDDRQYFGLYDGEGNWTTLWAAQHNTQSWGIHQINVSAYLGQIINLRFSVRNDGDDDTTALYIDDVRLEVCGQ
jgi:hypothetical protein